MRIEKVETDGPTQTGLTKQSNEQTIAKDRTAHGRQNWQLWPLAALDHVLLCWLQLPIVSLLLCQDGSQRPSSHSPFTLKAQTSPLQLSSLDDVTAEQAGQRR